jgi:hypothetical protein
MRRVDTMDGRVADHARHRPIRMPCLAAPLTEGQVARVWDRLDRATRQTYPIATLTSNKIPTYVEKQGRGEPLATQLVR